MVKCVFEGQDYLFVTMGDGTVVYFSAEFHTGIVIVLSSSVWWCHHDVIMSSCSSSSTWVESIAGAYPHSANCADKAPEWQIFFGWVHVPMVLHAYCRDAYAKYINVRMVLHAYCRDACAKYINGIQGVALTAPLLRLPLNVMVTSLTTQVYSILLSE